MSIKTILNIMIEEKQFDTGIIMTVSFARVAVNDISNLKLVFVMESLI
ncbi:UNVERIFIED_ORG: hypothetical protein ABIC81_004634 [Bacillus proteolyticus]|nr:hypothetical protein IEW_05349 [Bacillus mycoides]EJQ58189.1 hypothetical protein IEY_05346 [Bacillus mycoides]EJV59798.1 hypothetical protein IEU_05479 [Bacillus mycoides]